MLSLLITNNSVSNPQTLDLSPFVDVQDGSGLDIANPAFTNRVYSRSLLKEGASLALTQYVEKQLVFPLLLGPVGGYSQSPTTFGQMATLIERVNQLLDTPGAVISWQADQASQPTYFDVIAGQFEVAYSYRKEQQDWTMGNLRIFCQPFGRTAGPRPFAAASAVGPLLMISPYASGGALAIGASTQAGVAGYGGRQQGASSGIFYQGSPSLAGDAPGLLQVSYVGPLANTATSTSVVPYAAVSLLPDANYQPLIGVSQIQGNQFTPTIVARQGAVASQTIQFAAPPGSGITQFLAAMTFPAPLGGGLAPVAWAGQHRVFAIARASSNGSGASATLQLLSGQQVTIPLAQDWFPYDMGTYALRASEAAQTLALTAHYTTTPGASIALELTALVTLPDNATWFLNPTTIQGAQYGWPSFASTLPNAPYSNTLLLDDTVGDQFLYSGQSQTFAPNPTGMVASSGRISQFTRGLVPRPDPKNGLPIIAVLGVGQPTYASNGQLVTASASWANPQNLPTMAQVNVWERVRYVLP